MANFMDRVAFKAPKSREKLARRKFELRMARTARPVYEEVDEAVAAEGTEEAVRRVGGRVEEEFFHRYFREKRSREGTRKKQRGSVEERETGEEGGEDEEEREIDEFAQDVFDKEMRKMEGEGGRASEDEEDFFEGEEALSDLAEESDGGEAESKDESKEIIDEEEEDDEEMFQDMDGLGEEASSEDDKGKKKKQKKETSVFASYEDFAELLEESGKKDSFRLPKKRTHRPGDIGGKRGRGGPTGRGRGGSGFNKRRKT